MGNTTAARELAKAIVRDNRLGLEILKFGGVGTGLRAQINEFLGPLQIAVPIGGDVGNKISGVLEADGGTTNINLC